MIDRMPPPHPPQNITAVDLPALGDVVHTVYMLLNDVADDAAKTIRRFDPPVHPLDASILAAYFLSMVGSTVNPITIPFTPKTSLMPRSPSDVADFLGLSLELVDDCLTRHGLQFSHFSLE